MPLDWKKARRLIAFAVEGCMEEVTKSVTEDAQKRTPIGNPRLWKSIAPPGYVPGTLKASWEWSYDKASNTGTIINPQPYAERVEYGWSTQAPEGMLRIALKNAGLVLERAAKENKI